MTRWPRFLRLRFSPLYKMGCGGFVIGRRSDTFSFAGSRSLPLSALYFARKHFTGDNIRSLVYSRALHVLCALARTGAVDGMLRRLPAGGFMPGDDDAGLRGTVMELRDATGEAAM